MTLLGRPFRLLGDGGISILNSAYGDGSTGRLSKVLGSSGNRQRFVLHAIIKNAKSGAQNCCPVSSQNNTVASGYWDQFRIESDHTIRVALGNAADTGLECNLITTDKFSDPSAHLFVTVSVDTTQATASERVHLYVNGVRITAFGTATYPAQNFSAQQWNVSGKTIYCMWGASNYSHDYYSQILALDGDCIQQGDLAISDLVDFDASGNPIPVDAAALFPSGALSFWMKFENGADLGEDSSGNGNDFTVNGTITQTTDTPTDDAANDIGNFPTWDPLAAQSGVTLAMGNREATAAGGTYGKMSVPLPDTGEFYGEFTVTAGSAGQPTLGIALQSFPYVSGSYIGQGTNAYGLDALGRLWYNGSSNTYTTFTTGDVLAVRWVASTRDLYVGKVSGGTITWMNSGSPLISGLAAGDWFFVAQFSGGKFLSNFGQVAFAAASLPGSATPFCTAHLPAPSLSSPVTGSFTGNASTTDSPYVWLGGTPDTGGTCTINSNAITWDTHAIALAGGMKIITNSSSYNTSGSNTFSIAVVRPFGGEGVSQARAQ